MLTLIAQAAQPALDLRGQAQTQDLPGQGNVGASPEAYLDTYIGSLLTAIMVIAALLLLLYLIWGAIEWITSGGDSSKTGKARDKMSQAVIGIIVLSATIAVYRLVTQFLGLI